MEKFKGRWIIVTDKHSGQPSAAALTDVKNNIT
jgi:hypothetical protein